MSKIIKEIFRDIITVHMKENGLLNNKQFGFTKGRSTVLRDQLLKTITKSDTVKDI